jgi:multiple sugar transport system permease protein
MPSSRSIRDGEPPRVEEVAEFSATSPPSPRPTSLGQTRSTFLTSGRREALWAYTFLALPLSGLALFFFYPMLAAFWMSLHDWPMVGRDRPFVGLDNYVDAFRDSLSRKSFVNTVYYTVTVVPGTMVLGLGLALVLNLPTLRFRGFFRTTYYLPVITSWVAVSFIAVYVFEPTFGWMNDFLRSIGIDRPPTWLASPTWAMPAIIITSIWKSVGASIVLFLAGLQGIPQDCVEAAQVDGASKWQSFWHITLPLLNPTITFVAVVSVINSLQVFTPAVVMTYSSMLSQAGGPLDSTRVLVYHIYQTAFRSQDFGFAAAVSYILFAIVLVLTMVQLRLIQRPVNY